jgi:hypothetical protein
MVSEDFLSKDKVIAIIEGQRQQQTGVIASPTMIEDGRTKKGLKLDPEIS